MLIHTLLTNQQHVLVSMSTVFQSLTTILLLPLLLLLRRRRRRRLFGIGDASILGLSRVQNAFSPDTCKHS